MVDLFPWFSNNCLDFTFDLSNFTFLMQGSRNWGGGGQGAWPPNNFQRFLTEKFVLIKRKGVYMAKHRGE